MFSATSTKSAEVGTFVGSGLFRKLSSQSLLGSKNWRLRKYVVRNTPPTLCYYDTNDNTLKGLLAITSVVFERGSIESVKSSGCSNKSTGFALSMQNIEDARTLEMVFESFTEAKEFIGHVSQICSDSNIEEFLTNSINQPAEQNCGTFRKLGGSIISNWKLRNYHIMHDQTLRYYDPAEPASEKGKISIRSIIFNIGESNLIAASGCIEKNAVALSVTSSDDRRTLCVVFDSDIDARRFVKHLSVASLHNNFAQFKEKVPWLQGAETSLIDGNIKIRTAQDVENDLRKLVIAKAIELNTSGLSDGTSGNISVRCRDGMLITPSGIAYDTMDIKDVVFVKLDGTYSHPLRPSSEWRFHRDIYRQRLDVHAIVHAHPTYCTVLAIRRMEIPALHYMIAAAGGNNIRCAKYETFGTEELSSSALKALIDRTACLLANHGMIALGPSLPKAMWLAVEVEGLARQYVLSLSIGGPVILDDEEINRVLVKFKTYGLRSKEAMENDGLVEIEPDSV